VRRDVTPLNTPHPMAGDLQTGVPPLSDIVPHSPGKCIILIVDCLSFVRV